MPTITDVKTATHESGPVLVGQINPSDTVLKKQKPSRELKQLDRKVKELLQLKPKADGLKKDLKVLKAQVIELMLETGEHAVATDEGCVELNGEERNVFNVKKFRAENPALWAKYVETTNVNRLSVDGGSED